MFSDFVAWHGLAIHVVSTILSELGDHPCVANLCQGSNGPGTKLSISKKFLMITTVLNSSHLLLCLWMVAFPQGFTWKHTPGCCIVQAGFGKDPERDDSKLSLLVDRFAYPGRLRSSC
jgi:hypothetical protein